MLPGTYNTNYTYPTGAEVDYFMSKGMNTFRIPFRWERLQQSAGAAFDRHECCRKQNSLHSTTCVPQRSHRPVVIASDADILLKRWPQEGQTGDVLRSIRTTRTNITTKTAM